MSEQPQPVGYGAVAACISADRDLSLYRRFGALNSRNILYLQSELQALELELLELDNDANDRQKGLDTWAIPRSWNSLQQERGKHYEVVMKIRDRLDQYNRALAHEAWLLDLPIPRERPRNNLVSYLSANKSNMSEQDAAFLSDENRSDLVGLYSEEKELLFKFLERYFFWLFEKQAPAVNSRSGQMSVYSNREIRRVVRVMAIIFSSVLPLLSIVVLYYISSQTARLGCVVAFSALASAALATLSNAKNVEIIAATAAYGAIQVVFITGSNSRKA